MAKNGRSYKRFLPFFASEAFIVLTPRKSCNETLSRSPFEISLIRDYLN